MKRLKMEYYGQSHNRIQWYKGLRSAPIFLIATVLLAVIFSALFFFRIVGSIPDYSELRNIRHNEASPVISSDGEVLGRYYLTNRDRVVLEEINPEFIDALLAIEDIRFYEHNGIDYRALGRVFVRTMLLRQDAGGGSTLSQQLAKNLYPRDRNGPFAIVFNKIREILIAHRMERLYSKEEILELYVNTVSFGEDTWGIKTAAERYFNTSPDQLDLHQSATLAGMLRATTWYNPRRNPENAIQRRNLVIRQMEKYGMIDPGVSQEARDRPLDLEYKRLAQSEGSAPHFRTYLRTRLQQILATRPALDGQQYNLDTDGLVIVTTIDSRLQAAAEHAAETQLSELQSAFDRYRNGEPAIEAHDPMVYRAWRNSDRYRSMKEQGYEADKIDRKLDEPVPMDLFTWNGMKSVRSSPRDSIRHYLSILNAGFLAMHPGTGEIKAWVGGIPHHQFQYDHVRARRQTGSAFKPFVYAAALESGIKPCDYRRNLLSSYATYEDWTPSNLQGEYGGHYSVQAALSRSVNTISVELLMETGIGEVRETARKMGVSSHIPVEPSIALGTAELSLLEMVRAYTTFANRGKPAAPRYLKAIYNSDGQLIYDFRSPVSPVISDRTASGFSWDIFNGGIQDQVSPESFSDDDVSRRTYTEQAESVDFRNQAISEETASVMVNILSRAVESGSAAALRTQFGIRHAVAGKTGTTQNLADGWFVGMTPDLVFGSWVGGSTPSVQLPEEFGYASQTALPVAGRFLQQRDHYDELDPVPDRFHAHQWNNTISTDCEDYRDERLFDRVRDFFSGRDSEEVQVVDEEEGESVIGRIRSWFGSQN